MDERPLLDTLLIVYLIAFALLLAWAFERRSRVGWALAAFFLALAAAFCWSLLAGVWPPLAAAGWPGTAVRLGLAASMTWAAAEVCLMRWPWRRNRSS